MKNYLLSLFFIFTSVVMFSQWQLNGTILYNTNNIISIGSSFPQLLNQPKLLIFDNDNQARINIIGKNNFNGNAGAIAFYSPGEPAFATITGGNTGNGKGHLSFYTDNGFLHNEKVRITEDGDVMISNIGNGIIMKSPNDQCWKYIPDNKGRLISSLIECPNKTNTKLYETSDEIFIFPDSSRDNINIEIHPFSKNNYTALIYDLSGKLILLKVIASSFYMLDISDLKKGFYIVKIKDFNDKIVKTEKFEK